MPRCITCGLSVTRDSCPIIVDERLRRPYIETKCGFDKTTFIPYDIEIGYFSYGLKKGSTPRFWWHGVPMDAPTSVSCTRKLGLQAKAVFNGHKVLSAWTIADLERLKEGPFKVHMAQMVGEMKKEYRRRAKAAKAARTASFNPVNEEGASFVSQTTGIPPTQGDVEVSSSSSNARAAHASLQRPLRRLSSTMRGRAASVHSLESVSTRITNSSTTSMDTRSLTSVSGPQATQRPVNVRETLSREATQSSNEIPVPLPTVTPAMCIACDRPVHPRLCCPLVRGTFDNPDALYDPTTYEPTPVTFGHFTCMRRERDGVVAGWKQYYCPNINDNPPRLCTSLASPDRLDRLRARAILMGYALDALSPGSLSSMDDRGPFFASVQGFLASMVEEYTRRWNIATAARFPVRFSLGNPFAPTTPQRIVQASEEAHRTVERSRVRLRMTTRSASLRLQNASAHPINSVVRPIPSPAESSSAPRSADTEESREDHPATPRHSVDQPYPTLYDEVEGVNQEWAAAEPGSQPPISSGSSIAGEMPYLSSVENIAWRASRQASANGPRPTSDRATPDARVGGTSARPTGSSPTNINHARQAPRAGISLTRLVFNSLSTPRMGSFGSQAPPSSRRP